jgi:hypothetical protein
MMMANLKLEDIKYASVVVVGRIVDYEIVRPQDEVSKFWRKTYGQKDVLSDYARFKVVVDEVLAGQPPKVISVIWDNSTFGEPKKMKDGSYLIGLRGPGSARPPLRGPSATILPSQEPNSLTVLQAPCAPAFILDASSADVKTIRDLLIPLPKDPQGNHDKVRQHD